MGHGGVLVESGRARRSSADPRLHGGGSCSGPARAMWQFSDNQRRATRQLEGNQRKRSSLIGREVGGWAPVAGTKNPSWFWYFFLGSLLGSLSPLFAVAQVSLSIATSRWPRVMSSIEV
jgi:hypothetical protein